MWSCGGDSGAFCHRVRGAGSLEGVREQFGVTREEVLEEILLFRGRTHQKVERSISLLEEMWRRRRREIRNGPTYAGTCTSVVWAHGGADRKALPPKNIIIIMYIDIRSS